MIALFHVLYWTCHNIYNRLQDNLSSRHAEESSVRNYFEDQVKICDFTLDAEEELRFDPPVFRQRYSAVQEVLVDPRWRENIVKVVEYGCAEIKFFPFLKHSINIQEIIFVDIDEELLRSNSNRIQPFTVDYLDGRKKPLRVEILQGSIDSPDVNVISANAVICIEIIEHLYPDTLDALPHNIFYFIEPSIAIFTTPNADFNVLFKNFSGRRHDDHKFEWTRSQFEDWANNIVIRYPKYSVYFIGIGPGPKRTESLGCCSQMAVFVKQDTKDDFREQLLDKFRKLIPCLEEPEKLDLKDCVIDSYDISDFLSSGVCTYHSYVKTSSNCHNYMPYTVISEVDYPYRIDIRTEEEIIRHETEYKLHRLGSYTGMYFNADRDRVEIPLYMVTSNDGGEYITTVELRKILEKSFWKIEECELNNEVIPCVIYERPCETESSERSDTPDINYSTNVNWDSGSNWDVESVSDPDPWEESQPHPNMEKSIPLSETNTTVWEEPIGTELNDESPLSDPCVSSEQTERNFPIDERDERVELLFDSGYQVSTSSVELSPDLAKDWLQDEKREDAPRVMSDSDSVSMTESENYYHSCDDSGFKKQITLPKAHFIKIQKVVNVNKHKVEVLEQPIEPVNRNPVVAVPVPLVVPPAVDIPIVENGDLANNNRDREGNNYPAVAENIVLVDDNNALREPEVNNLDEHNENHIILDQIPEQHDEYFIDIVEPAEDDDGLESLEDVSREALFDPNSEVSISEESLVIRGQQIFVDYNPSEQRPVAYASLRGSSTNSVETFETTVGFPPWMLYLLQGYAEDEEPAEPQIDDGAHFYSQGDGLGIHPSNQQVPDEDSTSSSISTAVSNSTMALAEAPTHPNSRTSNSATTNSTSSFHEAEDGLAVLRENISIPLGPQNSRERDVATSMSNLNTETPRITESTTVTQSDTAVIR